MVALKMKQCRKAKLGGSFGLAILTNGVVLRFTDSARKRLLSSGTMRKAVPALLSPLNLVMYYSSTLEKFALTVLV